MSRRDPATHRTDRPARQAPLRLLVVDDHPLVRARLRDLLATAFLPAVSLTTAGAPEELEALLEAGEGAGWDLALVDLLFGGEARGLDVLARLRSTTPPTPALIVSSSESPALVRAAAAAGAVAYVAKTAPESELLRVVRAVLAGERPLAALLATLEPTGAGAMSERDRRIVAAIASGRTNREIAAAERLAEKTIEAIVARLCRSAGVTSRAALVASALRDGLIPGPDPRGTSGR